MHTTAFLIVKPEFREVFSSLETNEGRSDFLECQHEKELMRCLWNLSVINFHVPIFAYFPLKYVTEQAFGVLKQKWHILKGITSSLLVLRSISFLLVWHCIILFMIVIYTIRTSIDVMLTRATCYNRHLPQHKHKIRIHVVRILEAIWLGFGGLRLLLIVALCCESSWSWRSHNLQLLLRL